MKIIVQKFGGTSVTTEEKRNMAIGKVIAAIEKGYSPVVVVSAMGRKGDPYATDTLLSLVNGKSGSIDKREIDLLMCCGEIISAVVMVEAFAQRGYKARALTGGNAGIITDNNYGGAGVVHVETERILQVIGQGLIPVVTGFQGMTGEGDYTTLGRGGSDTTGALLGKALKAECVEIYTDVDGIMTTDPRIVPDAKIIDRISYDEVFQLADQGAKVIHPRAVEYAMDGNIPLIIKNAMTDAPGTLITNTTGPVSNSVTGITSMVNRTQISINISKGGNNGNDVFKLLAQRNISIDLINVFPDQKLFTVDSADAPEVEGILKKYCMDYQIVGNCSKISVIGNVFKEMPKVMVKIFRTLEQSNIRVLQTANSRTTVWCLVKEDDTKRAMNELHNAFFI